MHGTKQLGTIIFFFCMEDTHGDDDSVNDNP